MGEGTLEARSNAFQALLQRAHGDGVRVQGRLRGGRKLDYLDFLFAAALLQLQPQDVAIFQLLVGYIGLCLKNGDSAAASRLALQTLESMVVILGKSNMPEAHKAVIEAYLYDTALSVAYYSPSDVQLAEKAESFFQQATEKYLKLKHYHRFAKCSIRYAAVLFTQNHFHESEYFLQQALNKLQNEGTSSLLVVCYHNLAGVAAIQNRVADAASHMRTYISLLRQMTKLSSSWVQKADNTQWLILKMQELWPAHQAQMTLNQ